VRPDGWDLAFGLLVLLQVAAVLALRHLPTVDGPAHLAGARVLTNWRLPIYRHYYAIDLFPSPNLLAGLLLAGLLRVAEPAWADKLLAAGYLVLFPLALRYAVAGVNRSARWLAFLAFPLSCGYLFWYGFANYGYGVAGALFAVGFALRHGPNWTPRSTLGLGALLLLCYATHLVPFALAVLFVTVTGVVSAAVGQRAGDPDWRRPVLAPALAAAPALGLTAAFALRGGAHSAPTWRPVPELGGGLLSLAMPTVTFVHSEAVVSGLIALVLYVVGVFAVRRRRGVGTAGLAGAAIAATTVYLVAPNQLGLEYGLINTRISIFPILFAVLWLAAHPVGVRVQRVGAGVLALAAVALAVLRAPDVLRYDRQVSEYATTARVIAPGSTLVALRVRLDSPLHGPARVKAFDPLRHGASLIAAQTRGVDVGHYEAQYNYFPTRFRPDADLRRRIDPDLTGLEAAPAAVTLPGDDAVGHDRIDYVLVVNPDAGGPRATSAGAQRDTAAVTAILAGRYRLVYRTAPTGLVEVYARQ